MPGDVQIRQLKYLVSLAHERHFRPGRGGLPRQPAGALGGTR
jgi:hypothetical protein